MEGEKQPDETTEATPAAPPPHEDQATGGVENNQATNVASSTIIGQQGELESERCVDGRGWHG